MANLILNGSTSGSVTLSSPAVSGTTTLTLPTTSGTIITTATGQTLTAPSVSGNLTMTTGGITFNANPGGGAQAVLNDFEQGSFTPKAGDGTSAMGTIRIADYIRINNMVTIYLDVTLPNPNPTNNNYITNLPFAGVSGSAGNGGGGVAYTDFQGTLGFHVTANTTNLYGFNNANNTTANISGKRVIISFVYQSAA